MTRTASIRDEDILEAARAVFLERGVAGTTAEVAARAGVSEGSIFNRFKTKEALFFAAMELPNDPPWIASLSQRVGQGEVGEQIAEIVDEGVAFFRLIIPISMMRWSSRPHRRTGSSRRAPLPIQSMKGIAAYFDAEMGLGRLRSQDAEVVARTLTGAMWNYVAMEILFNAGELMPMPQGVFVRSLVQLLWTGLAPGTLPPSPQKAG